MQKLDPEIRRRLEKLLKFRRLREKTVGQYLRELSELSRRVLTDREAEASARVFAALSDMTRIKILRLLGKREMCVCELMVALGLSQPAASYHLRILQSCRLIKPVRKGKWIFYELSNRRLLNLVNKFIELA